MWIAKQFIITNNGPVEWFLGVHFREYADGGYHTNQTAYLEQCLACYGIEDKPGCATPMVKGYMVSAEDIRKNPDPKVV